MELDLAACLDQCGLSQAQIDAIHREGYVTMTDFSLNRYSDIDSFAKKLQALPTNRGGLNLGHMHVVRLKAFLYWLKNRIRRGINIYDDYDEDFGQVELEASIKALETLEGLDKAGESKTKAPEKFQLHSLRGWTSLNRDLENYLASLRGISGVPLVYVIRKEAMNHVAPPGEDAIQELVRLAPLEGPVYLEDKRRVYRIIRDTVSGTDGWTWMQDVKNEDGREAIKLLRDHYDGPGARTRRVQDAKERLKVCHYKAETTFPFERYVSVLKDCFATLSDDERPVTECDKIDYLLDGIQNASLASAISNISMTATLRPSFEETANILLREVQRIFPLAANKGKRTIAQMEADHDNSRTIGAAGRGRGGRGRGGGGRGRGRGGRGGGNPNGGRGGGGRVMLQGVDVTDPKRTFSKDEWNKLKGQWQYIWDRRGGRGAGNDSG